MSEAGNREWFYLRGGQKVGPVSLEELRQLAATGQIQPQDSVWKAGMAQWAPAHTIPDLLLPPPLPPPAPPPPPPVSPPVPARAGPEDDDRSRRRSRRDGGRRDDYDDEDRGQSRSGKQGSSKLKWLLIGGVLLVGGCCGVPAIIMGLAGFGHKVQQEEQAKKVEQSKDVIPVSATALFQAFKNNAVDANNKYKGKVVEVTGTVHAVEERYVELNEDNGPFLLGLVHVYLDGKSKEKMGTLNKGQSIKVRGICTGKSFASVDIESAVLLD